MPEEQNKATCLCLIRLTNETRKCETKTFSSQIPINTQLNWKVKGSKHLWDSCEKLKSQWTSFRNTVKLVSVSVFDPDAQNCDNRNNKRFSVTNQGRGPGMFPWVGSSAVTSLLTGSKS